MNQSLGSTANIPEGLVASTKLLHAVNLLAIGVPLVSKPYKRLLIRTTEPHWPTPISGKTFTHHLRIRKVGQFLKRQRQNQTGYAEDRDSCQNIIRVPNDNIRKHSGSLFYIFCLFESYFSYSTTSNRYELIVFITNKNRWIILTGVTRPSSTSSTDQSTWYAISVSLKKYY